MAAPAFPVIIIALVPVRLLVMKRVWGRETLRFVDAWACKDGTPEDDEDRRNGVGVGIGLDLDDREEGKKGRGEMSSGTLGEEIV